MQQTLGGFVVILRSISKVRGGRHNWNASEDSQELADSLNRLLGEQLSANKARKVQVVDIEENRLEQQPSIGVHPVLQG